MKREHNAALVAALLCAAAVAVYSEAAFEDEARNYRLWYYTPAAGLAGAFAVSRIREGPHGRWRWLLDLFVAVVCLARPLTGQPPVSGHALFAVHALITCRNPVARGLAVIVAGITLYAKIVLWHWDTTLWPGLAAGVVSGMLWRILRKCS